MGTPGYPIVVVISLVFSFVTLKAEGVGLVTTLRTRVSDFSPGVAGKGEGVRGCVGV